ncbi:MAG: hypothetical protein NTW81_04035 [Actinobacteria bacterium]|nr:hypothetical protein [Actinomycetota bacterium]
MLKLVFTMNEVIMKSRLPVATYEQVAAALFCFGWVASIVVAAHRTAFFVHPFSATDMVRRVELFAFILGWVLLCAGPVFLAVRMLLVEDSQLRYLWIVALFYPASVLAIQFTLYFQNNRWYFNYLQENRWFVVTDVVVPIGLFLVDRVVRNSRVTTSDEVSIAETESEFVH